MNTVWRVFVYFRRYPFLALGMLLCAILGTLLLVVFPLVTRDVVEVVIRQNHPEKLMGLLFLGVAAAVLQNGLRSLRLILNNTLEQRVIFDLRSDLYSHIQLLPLRWFDNRATGDLMTRLLEDVTSVERMLIDGIDQGLVALLQMVVVFAIMCNVSLTLTLTALSPALFLAAGALWYTLTAHRRYRVQRRAVSAMNALLHDNLSGIRQIRSFAREDDEHRRFNQASDKVRKGTLVVMKVWAIYNPSMYLIGTLGVITTTFVGTRAVLSGTMQLGDLVMFLLLAAYFYEPVGTLHQLNQLVQAGRAAGERVFEIMDEPVEPGQSDLGLTSRIAGDIRYDNVSFTYSEGGSPALLNVSFHARPGESIALVGATGSGKSTLVNLLPRFYEFTEGQIYIDGRPIRDYRQQCVREAIGVVTQESFLFNGTIRENLLMGKPEASEAEIWRAVDAANARAFIERLPEGLESVVGERGVKLSVGEKQRISIARALLKDPPILILDEATASVDTATERLIQEALEHLMANRTSIVIAHRLSTIVGADQILVLDRGRIIERGKHDNLISAGGKYAQLCRQSLLESSPDKKETFPRESGEEDSVRPIELESDVLPLDG